MVMKCRQVQKYLDDFLFENPDGELHSELIEHIVNCPECAHKYDMARQTLTSIQLSHKVRASDDLKQHIMSKIGEMKETNPIPEKQKFWKIIKWKLLYVAGAAVFLLSVISVLFLTKQKKDSHIALQLLSQAWAAEEALFVRDEIVHSVNEIIVKPISDPDLSGIRWFPVVSIDASGKPEYHQLNLPAEPGECYTVSDESWFDSNTGKFIHLLSFDGIPIFANSFDGGSIYSLEKKGNGNWQIIGKPVGKEFHPPENPADFLGIAAGLTDKITKKDVSLITDVSDAKLLDGSKARFLKVGLQSGAPFKMVETYWIYKIRESNNTIDEMEWIIDKESLMAVRRLTTEAVVVPGVPWNLTGTDSLANASTEPPKASIRPNMVISNVTVRYMIENADYETYIFAVNPSWTNRFDITDILDVVNPPHRMFAITYHAEDGRHVMFLQSHTFNEGFGLITKASRLKYTSPNGFKVWSGLQDKWLAKILLNSARSTIKDSPSEDRTGYILETPAGTFPCIAINGKLSDDEFHNLINSLIQAREFTGK